jgi:hypothetical protein
VQVQRDRLRRLGHNRAGLGEPMPAGWERAAIAARRIARNLREKNSRLRSYDTAVVALLLAVLVIALATLKSYAISNDEQLQQRYGELIVAYYVSGFRDQSLFHYDNLYLYGGLFDIAAALIQRALPFIDPYVVRHLLSVSTGIAGIAGSCITARLVAGQRAGALAALALTVCGCWYGAMFNHTKDIPFAAAMVWATFFLLRTGRALPRPRRRDIVAFGLMLGAALGIRVLGLLLVGYAAFAVVAQLPRRQASGRDQLAFFAESAAAFAPAFCIGYAIMAASWPWSVLSPLNPIRGLIDFGNFHYQIRTLLAGEVYTMATVPRWYVPAYISIRLPIIMLIGAVLAAALSLGRKQHVGEPRRNEIGLLAVTALFPIVCEVVDHGPAFTGLRHFLFVVPLIAALSGIGLEILLQRLPANRPIVARGTAATIASLLIWNAANLVRLHPYENLYYNPLVGGLKGAAGRYATDYWVSIMPEAVSDLESYIENLDRHDRHSEPYSVAVCGERLPFEKQANRRLRWTADWSKAEFFIAPTHMNCDRALNGHEIATIVRLGARIGVVKDRRALLNAEVRRWP